MRYRFFIARKPALTVCLLLIALWAPGSQSARRTAGDSTASSVRIKGQDVSTFLSDGVGEPLQPKPKAPNGLESPRLIALARKVKAGNRAALKLFWEEVQGKTPLVEPVPNDDQLRRVTFLWRGGAEASEVRLDGQGRGLTRRAATAFGEHRRLVLTVRLPRPRASLIALGVQKKTDFRPIKSAEVQISLSR